VLANVQGQGTFAVAGFGTVVAGPTVAVTGGAGALTTMISSYGPTDEAGTGSSGTASLALLTNYMASTFATPAGEGTGVVMAAQSPGQDFLTKPAA
jgi:hypothetical protein